MFVLDLFTYFESDGEEIFSVPKLGIISYGVSMTTLEEVFLKLEEEEEQEKEDVNNHDQKINNETSHLTLDDENCINTSTLELNPPELISNARRCQSFIMGTSYGIARSKALEELFFIKVNFHKLLHQIFVAVSYHFYIIYVYCIMFVYSLKVLVAPYKLVRLVLELFLIKVNFLHQNLLLFDTIFIF